MAIRITRVYTRKGDKGETAVVGGARLPKDSPRIVAYGTVDELNSILGVVRAHAQATTGHSSGRIGRHRGSDVPGEAAVARLDSILERLQNELFDLGSELATPADAEYEGMWHVSADEVRELERVADECQKTLEPLRSFVLPGGGVLGATLHHARTVCRRAEIEVLRLSRQENLNPEVLRYVNRLSDLLFVLARWIARETGEAEHLWERGLRLPKGRGKRKQSGPGQG